MEQQQSVEILQDIKGMLHKSSRFISLSGLSGIAAGTFALIGALMANYFIRQYYIHFSVNSSQPKVLLLQLVITALAVFVLALSSAVFFTWRKCKIDAVKFGGYTSRKLFYNTILPMIVGGIFIIRLLQMSAYNLVISSCLLFYGLALVIGSKYTLGEIKWVGFINIALGLFSLWMPQQGLFFWTMGFGVAHIVYGVYMWRKYEMK